MAVDETSNDLDENPNNNLGNNLGKDASNTTVKDTAPNQNQKSALVWLGVLLVIALGIYFQNPAYALLGALALRLILDVNPIKQSGTIGKLSLQTAIVLLGFSLGIDSLMQMSSDYGLIVAVFVLGTLGLGLLMGRLLRSDRGGNNPNRQRYGHLRGYGHCHPCAADQRQTSAICSSHRTGIFTEYNRPLDLSLHWHSAGSQSGSIWCLGGAGNTRHQLCDGHSDHIWRRSGSSCCCRKAWTDALADSISLRCEPHLRSP